MSDWQLYDLLYLVLLLAVLLLAWRFPRIGHRKFDWKSLKNGEKQDKKRARERASERKER